MKRHWRFIDTGVNNGFLNMSIDEAILEAHLQGFVPPTLRVYRWHPPALSIGYLQRLEAGIETKRCSESGIDVVRRLTGGRAVLHDDELTYSVIVSQRYGFPKSIALSYELLSTGLIAAYRIVGLEAHLTSHSEGPSSAACFASAGPADLTFQGRKIAGSAQFRKGDTLLQHGSLLIRLDAQLLLSMLKFPSTGMRDEVLVKFVRKTAGIGEILGSQIGWQELKGALFRGFQEALGIELEEAGLTQDEIDQSQRLARDKYGTFGWNYGR